MDDICYLLSPPVFRSKFALGRGTGSGSPSCTFPCSQFKWRIPSQPSQIAVIKYRNYRKFIIIMDDLYQVRLKTLTKIPLTKIPFFRGFGLISIRPHVSLS